MYTEISLSYLEYVDGFSTERIIVHPLRNRNLLATFIIASLQKLVYVLSSMPTGMFCVIANQKNVYGTIEKSIAILFFLCFQS